jgi:hypothetical protein
VARLGTRYPNRSPDDGNEVLVGAGQEIVFETCLLKVALQFEEPPPSVGCVLHGSPGCKNSGAILAHACYPGWRVWPRRDCRRVLGITLSQVSCLFTGLSMESVFDGRGRRGDDAVERTA